MACKKHTDVLGEFEDNTKRVFGGRRQYCFNSKTYYKYTEKIVRELANHFKNEEDIVAVIYDYESMASFRVQRQSFLMDYKQEVYRLYRPFYEKNVNIYVIPSYVDFSMYKVLLIPTMIVFKNEVQERC